MVYLVVDLLLLPDSCGRRISSDYQNWRILIKTRDWQSIFWWSNSFNSCRVCIEFFCRFSRTGGITSTRGLGHAFPSIHHSVFHSRREKKSHSNLPSTFSRSTNGKVEGTSGRELTKNNREICPVGGPGRSNPAEAISKQIRSMES